MAACVLLLSTMACADQPDEAAPATPPEANATNPTVSERWTVDTVNAPRFRAFGWATDTLWGIARGRLAFFADSALVMLNDTVWGVWTAPGHSQVAWLNGSGAYVRSGAANTRVLHPDDAPPDAGFGPEMSWRSGTRALLGWTSDGVPPISVLEGGAGGLTHRVLDSRAGTGEFATLPAVWLDDARAVVTVVAHRARSGESMPSEGGRRANLGILDIAADTIRLITDVPDGTFLRLEGMLHPDTVLVAVRQGNAPANRHVTYDTRTWTQRPRLDAPGRAAPCGGHIGLLRAASDPAAGGELVWDAELHVARGGVTALGRYTGFDVRLLWDEHCRRLVIAQESESNGYLTVVVKQVP